MTTPKTTAPEWAASQATPWVTVNEALRRIEAGAAFYPVVDKDLTTPPGSCADGAIYIVGGGGGAWVGHIGDIAIAVGANAVNGWYFRDPEEGVFAWVQDEDVLYRCTTGTSPASWVAATFGATTIDGLTDVDTSSSPGASNGQVLTWNASAGLWVPGTLPTGVTTLDGLTDVDVSSSPVPATADLLAYDGALSLWRPESATQMIDRVVGAGVAQGDILFRGATAWSRLAAGTSGYLLKTQGAAADPVWVAPPSGGGPGGGSFRGALVTKAADQTGANYTTSPNIAWDSESYDTDGIHDNSTNNTRLTVPSGVTKVRLLGAAFVNNLLANNFINIGATKNGGNNFVGSALTSVSTSNIQGRAAFTTAVVTVTAGDYFEMFLTTQSDTSVDVLKDVSWFAMEIIE